MDILFYKFCPHVRYMYALYLHNRYVNLHKSQFCNSTIYLLKSKLPVYLTSFYKVYRMKLDIPVVSIGIVLNITIFKELHERLILSLTCSDS